MSRSTVHRLRAAARREDGFTLIELVVTMSLAVVVLLAVLGAADVFSRSTATATRLSVSQEDTRATLREITNVLREARVPANETSPIQHTNPTGRGDLIAAAWVSDADGTSRPGFVRYCVAGGTLFVGRLVADAWPAGVPGACGVDTPAPAAGTTSVPATTTPTPATGWVYGRLLEGALADPDVFDYSSDTCFGATGTGCPPQNGVDVRAVGIRLSVRTGDASSPRSLTLTGAVSLRNRS